MKLSLSFVFYSVLIYGTICCANVAAEDTKDVDVTSDMEKSDAHENVEDEPCITEYLKNKGKLDASFPSEKPSPLCRFTMIEVIRIVREMFKDKMKTVLPNEIDCFMTEYDKSLTVDNVLTIAMIKIVDLPETERDALSVGPLNAMKDQLKEMCTKCGVGDEKFMLIFGKIFETKRKTTTKTSTDSETASKTAASETA